MTFGEVAAYALLQIFGFTDVKYPACAINMLINTRFIGQCFEDVF